MGDGITVGVVLQRLEQSALKKHLLHNSEPLMRWADFRAEVIYVRRGQ